MVISDESGWLGYAGPCTRPIILVDGEARKILEEVQAGIAIELGCGQIHHPPSAFRDALRLFPDQTLYVAIVNQRKINIARPADSCLCRQLWDVVYADFNQIARFQTDQALLIGCGLCGIGVRLKVGGGCFD